MSTDDAFDSLWEIVKSKRLPNGGAAYRQMNDASGGGRGGGGGGGGGIGGAGAAGGGGGGGVARGNARTNPKGRV